MSERTGIAHRLWSIEDIAEYASYGLTMARKVASQPDFPSPIRIFDRSSPRPLGCNIPNESVNGIGYGMSGGESASAC